MIKYLVLLLALVITSTANAGIVYDTITGDNSYVFFSSQNVHRTGDHLDLDPGTWTIGSIDSTMVNLNGFNSVSATVNIYDQPNPLASNVMGPSILQSHVFDFGSMTGVINHVTFDFDSVGKSFTANGTIGIEVIWASDVDSSKLSTAFRMYPQLRTFWTDNDLNGSFSASEVWDIDRDYRFRVNTVSAVPEPSSFVLAGLGLVGLVVRSRKR